MVKLIIDFNEFMEKKYSSLAMGYTPSGFLHVGFLTTLACAFMYLKEHPNTRLIITNIENSLSNKLSKYQGVPLRFQYLEERGLAIPKDVSQMHKRNSAARAVQRELNDLIWKLVTSFDQKTTQEIKRLDRLAIPASHKDWLLQKENRLYHVFDSHIISLSFVHVLENSSNFRRLFMSTFLDPRFAEISSVLTGIDPKAKRIGNAVIKGEKRYEPFGFAVPIRLYCPNCYQVSATWASIVTGHPTFGEPTLATLCANKSCKRNISKIDDGFILQKVISGPPELMEVHFMADPIRDFFEPFYADCHIFGGDYFQLEYERSGMTAISKIEALFSYMEGKTNQQKHIFCGPLITMDGRKMSKSDTAFNIKDIPNVKKAFINIIEVLENYRAQKVPGPLQMDYREIIRRAA